MADGVDTGAGEPGQEKVELRIAVSGTHTRRDDLEALHTWLQSAPVLEDALERGEAGLARKDSLTQTEAMSGELIQDIILVVSVEVARSVTENAWRSVETWLRNRRRFADPEETPRVTLDGPSEGPGSGLSRDTEGRDTDGRDTDGRDTGNPGTGRRDSGSGRDGDPDAGPGTGPGSGGPNRPRGGDEPGQD
ncbi:hypothetical protein [Streptomyces glycanivorans]|uniref:Uncharacterized protein n=1 Tax=Streptomyces glycanivorans TaxID=3033808 RepID=A0ABY9JET2_9ACTN|nr:hypothetical protein [Streptomyces sp. Alt3]WLQ66225.1 hypothetical protein P8A20_22765 [Streptomyces sp. Alt3]